MHKKTTMKPFNLDQEEQEIHDAIESGQLKSVAHVSSEIKKARLIAQNTLRKDERVNIRLSSRDLMHLKHMAAYKGLPYQTFIASILHEYAAGHFKPV